jgi:sugar phosphate isomerase/epimerase
MKFPSAYTVISDEVSQDLAVVRAFVREFNLPGIELRSLNGRAFKDLTREDIAAVAATARAEGWKVFGCSTPVFKCAVEDDAAIREHREIFQRSLEVAHTLQCDLLRVFTFLRQPNTLEPQRLARIREHLAGLVDLARGSGVRVGVENEASCMIATIAETVAVMQGLPIGSCGVIWDPCNVLYVPEATPPAPADIAAIASRLLHVHVKDAVRRTATLAGGAGPLPAIAMPIGAGEVGWRAHLRALHAAGYQGMLSMETHWRLVNLDESMLHLPAGHAFSHGGEAASRICFHNLKAIADSL